MHEKLALWGLHCARPRHDLPLPGSPERCVKRVAAEDTDNAVWMVERLHPTQPARRERIGRLLAHLASKGLPVPAYRPVPGGGYTAAADGFHWQLSPFIPGDPLPQPDYVDHPERGRALGTFLADLSGAVEDFEPFAPEPNIAFPAYIRDLLETLRIRKPDLYPPLLEIREMLAPTLEAWNDLPFEVCHGDFHPLNVIWKDRSVAAVVDWEFSGLRPCLYDAANCMGCAGIEDPDALGNGLVPALLRTLHDRNRLPEPSFDALPRMITALRFAWMSEWLRRDDTEMIRLELRYMRLLADNLDALQAMFRKIVELK